MIKPPLHSRYRGPAFRAIEAVLREDPVLLEYVRTWRTRQGNPGELGPPVTGEMPLVALSPVPYPNEQLGVDETKANFGVSIQTFVEGTRVDDLIALWEAIEQAIVYEKPFRDTTVRRYLCSVIDPTGPAGLIFLRPVRPAFEEVDLVRPPKNLTFQAAKGSLVCILRMPANISFQPA